MTVNPRVRPQSAKNHQTEPEKTREHKRILIFFIYLLEITSDGCHGNSRKALVALCSPVNYCTSTSFTNKINNPEFPMKPEVNTTPTIRSKDVLWSHSADMVALFVLSARGMCTVCL